MCCMCGRRVRRFIDLSRFAFLASPLLDCAKRRIGTAIGITTAVAIRLEEDARVRSLLIRLIIETRECLFIRLIAHDAPHEHESRERVGR